MSNAPVYYALAKANFNPVTAMRKYVSEIQDQLRRQGYPLFAEQQMIQLVVPGPGQEEATEPQIKRMESWLITRKDRTAGFILEASAISYHTTHYGTHNEFIQELLQGLQAVHAAASLDHVSRLGLRYLNAVLPRSGDDVEKYLAAGLHGIEFDATPVYRFTESVFRTKIGPLLSEGTLVARVHRMTAPLGFPPDLQPRGLMANRKFEVKEPQEHAVIDTDHFVEGLMPIDPEQLRQQLLTLHGTIKSVFWATTTEYARKAWA